MTLKPLLLLLPAATLALSAQAAPVNYTFDPSHTYPSFEVPHLGISWWRGKFNRNSGTVVLDRAAKTGSLKVSIDAASVDFGHDKMNEHARAEDFFNVEQFPEITYRGTIGFKGDTPASVQGELTLLGVTKPVNLEILSFKCIEHPFFKREVCGADAYGEFNRADFGMTKWGEGAMGKVRLRIQAEALRDE